MLILEAVAVAFGIAGVWLSIKERIAAWPTAIVNVLLYFVVFAHQKLYAQMGLQLFYAAISVYGWIHWTRGGQGAAPLRVSPTPPTERWLLPLMALAFVGIVGTGLARWTDAALPWVDSALTAGSLCAQWMMSRKYLENWALWVALDVGYVTLFLTRGLVLTAFLYGVFLVLAARGHVEWRRSMLAATAPS